jgi:hypothetical protein
MHHHLTPAHQVPHVHHTLLVQPLAQHGLQLIVDLGASSISVPGASPTGAFLRHRSTPWTGQPYTCRGQARSPERSRTPTCAQTAQGRRPPSPPRRQTLVYNAHPTGFAGIVGRRPRVRDECISTLVGRGPILGTLSCVVTTDRSGTFPIAIHFDSQRSSFVPLQCLHLYYRESLSILSRVYISSCIGTPEIC